MKKMIIATLIGATSLISAMDKQITFPSSEEIRKNFVETGAADSAIDRLGYHIEFADKTMSIKEIAEKVTTINSARLEDRKILGREDAKKHIQKMTPVAVKILLKNNPDVVDLVLEKVKELK